MIDGLIPLVLKVGAVFAIGGAVYINVPSSPLQPAVAPYQSTAIYEQTFQLQTPNVKLQGE